MENQLQKALARIKVLEQDRTEKEVAHARELSSLQQKVLEKERLLDTVARNDVDDGLQ